MKRAIICFVKPRAFGSKNNTPLALFIFTLVVLCLFCNAQSPVEVSDPRLEIRDNTLQISYDILNGAPDDRYFVSIVIEDEDGNKINARAFEGDVGGEVTGGINKRVLWDLKKDNVFINTYVFVKINATVVPADDAKATGFSRAGILLQSLAFPGLGLSRVTGKPHWIRGVAGYGCIAGSVILNRQAVNTFETIENLDDTDDINNAFDKSVQQDQFSEILAFAAIGIWVTDMIWTFVGTSDLKKPSLHSETRGLSFSGSVDPISNIPQVGFIYRF